MIISREDCWKYAYVSHHTENGEDIYEAKIFTNDKGEILPESYSQEYLNKLKNDENPGPGDDEKPGPGNGGKSPKSGSDRKPGFFSKFIRASIKVSGMAVSSQNRTLQIGSRGDDVRSLQLALGVKPDGIYGPQTEAAVKAYQLQHGLAPDGIVGPNTWGSIGHTHPGMSIFSALGRPQGQGNNRPLTRHAKVVNSKPKEQTARRKTAPVPKRAKLKQASRPTAGVSSSSSSSPGIKRTSLLTGSRKALVKPVKPAKPVASRSMKKKIASGTSSHSSSSRYPSSVSSSKHTSSVTSTSKKSSSSTKPTTTKKSSTSKKSSGGIFGGITKKRK